MLVEKTRKVKGHQSLHGLELWDYSSGNVSVSHHKIEKEVH